MKELSEYFKSLLFYFDEETTKKFEKGIINNFRAYVQRVSSDVVRVQDGKICVPDSLITDDYFCKYVKKCENDYNAQDCAYLALNHVGFPPVSAMSIESLRKTVDEILKEYQDVVYVKRSRNANTYCVDWNTAQKISFHPLLTEKIAKQIKDAEKVHQADNSVEWRAYQFEKQKIEALEANNSYDNNEDYTPVVLSTAEKTNLLANTIYKTIFSNFDFEKYENYLEEMDLLYDAWDFGERYQELYDIFNAPDYKGEFYKISPDDAFLDALADKIADKIIEKMGNKKSDE